MQLAALQHRCTAPFAYPVGDDHLRVILKAADGDLDAAACIFGDRYAWPPSDDAPLPMERLGGDGVHEYWGVTLPAPARRVRYRFGLEGRDGAVVWLAESGLHDSPPDGGFFQYAYIHRADRFRQPDWLRDAILYQIFPDRFCNGDPANDPPGVGPWGERPTPRYVAGGDLAGIRSRLDYLADLGVGCIYTTPVFRSPSNHKYDTADYYQVDPAFGTNAELADLVAAAHQRGIRFLLDAVFNHSGALWPPFQDVIARGADSPYRDWFYDLRGFPVDPAACNYETFANRVSTMPKLNTGNPELAAYLLDVAEHWLREAGVDGWRLDVANEVDHRFWRAFRDRVKGLKPDAFILGEVWHDALDWLGGDQFDSVMDYPWRDATLAWLTGRIDAGAYDRWLTRLRFRYTAEASRGLVRLLSTHDTARVRTVVGSRERAAQAAVLLLTCEGVPMILYGDEVGLEGGDDPDCRRCYPWDDEEPRDLDLLSLYRRLGRIRRAFPWLNDGAWQTVRAEGDLLAYLRLPTPLHAPERPADEEGLLVVLNGGTDPVSLALPPGDWVDLLAGEMQTGRLERAPGREGRRGRRKEIGQGTGPAPRYALGPVDGQTAERVSGHALAHVTGPSSGRASGHATGTAALHLPPLGLAVLAPAWMEGVVRE